MANQNWNELKQSKNFYRNRFRTTISWLFLMLALNIILIVSIFFKIITTELPGFYATSGVIRPIKIKSLPTPNEADDYLLPPDQPDEIGQNKTL